ncbi:FAD/NAD(P)-binding domain-containing protein [Aspergillus homomorphus CBS 101889]|uniref:FAD/NAD(P)-binding domain-containing protein n=1 Tax=Aspergillus homomorphus (strain CBS 101889) TaxID=1450537 RepID=A0A395HYS2_ASPHC|nr:FAD/NAD(P)-binding domain-containing protein [Aspergillus homomorphus CBS 101889]RAL12847.1 FAD/NAD(P)-binding domain-containing protein [Aspergillus homomorphus CBS 101889]
MPRWPRLQLLEIGDQTWCPGWLHQHEQFTLTQLWNLRIPGWSHGSLATQACEVFRKYLPDLTSYTVVDLCAGAGGPTPVLERELNQTLAKHGKRPVTFLLTDLYPHLDAWQRINKKQPSVSYLAEPVDARSHRRYADAERKECRIFNICFHHFDDEDARGILRSAVRSADAFVIFEITARDLRTCLCSPLVFFFTYLVTLRWYWWSPLHLFFTYVLPVAPLSLWLDGLVSCLRTRTPLEVKALLQQDGLDLSGWEFKSGKRTVQWPFITLHYFVGVKSLGGLACAIASAQQGLHVVLLEKSPDLHEAGAGIQIPPNGTRVMRELGILPALLQHASVVQHVDFRRYDSGRLLRSMPFGEGIVREFGAPWLIVHRVDYHRVLYEEAVRCGVEVRFGVEVLAVEGAGEGVELGLRGGERISGDLLVGADGLWSQVRGWVVGEGIAPRETGDLAYRAVIPATQLQALRESDAKVDELCRKVAVTSYLGPEKHTIFYPVRGGREYNLVLLRPDNLPAGARKEEAGVREMRESYAGWDSTLEKLLSQVTTVYKWKLTELPELPTWTKGRVTLLGDACHPTLPYQAQGAAMAVEDGAVLGRLLGLLQSHLSQLDLETREKAAADSISPVLKLYESLRRGPTTRKVRAARINRSLLHIPDGILQRVRDFGLGYAGVTYESDWTWAFSYMMRQTLGPDVIRDCEIAFEEWVRASGGVGR